MGKGRGSICTRLVEIGMLGFQIERVRGWGFGMLVGSTGLVLGAIAKGEGVMLECFYFSRSWEGGAQWLFVPYPSYMTILFGCLSA